MQVETDTGMFHGISLSLQWLVPILKPSYVADQVCVSHAVKYLQHVERRHHADSRRDNKRETPFDAAADSIVVDAASSAAAVASAMRGDGPLRCVAWHADVPGSSGHTVACGSFAVLYSV